MNLNKMNIVNNNDLDYINFISRTSKNLGVSARVKKINEVEPFPSGLITVALGGAILSSFVQQEYFYTAQNVMVLIPKKEMTFQEKLFYCTCIEKNKYRYSAFGREANRTLRMLQVPKEPFKLIYDTDLPNFENIFEGDDTKRVDNLGRVNIIELFDIRYGANLELNSLEKVEEKNYDTINFVSRTSQNNGVSAIVKKVPGINPIPSGVLTVAGGGSVLETFYQDEPFYSGRDLYYLIPKFEMTIAEKLFYCMCIKANKYRYNYGRQANRTLKELKIPAQVPYWVNEESINSLVKIIS